MDHEIGRVKIGEVEVAYRIAGEGPPLLLLHGAVCDGRVWRRQMEEFSDEFCVVAWDAPGCGDSSDPPSSFGLAEYADCLARLAASLALERPHVLGHSFGGALALQFAISRPGVAASLVVAAGYAGWAGSLAPEEVQTRLALAHELARQVGGLTPDALPGLASATTPPAEREELAAIMRDVRGPGTRIMADALARADLRGSLPTVGIPTLLLYGDADQRAPRRVAEDLHSALPDSELVFLPGVGHELFMENPEGCHAAVRSFLRTVT